MFQKKIKVDDGRKKYKGDADIYTKDSEIRKFRAKGLYKSLIQIGDIAKVSVGELVGIENNTIAIRQYSCICNSVKAKVLCISKNDFFKRVKGEDINEYINNRNQAKEKEINDRAVMWKFIAEENASSLSPMQIRKRDKEVERILQIEKNSVKFEKNSTAPMFSKRVAASSNEYLHKAIDHELKQSRSQLYSKKNIPAGSISTKESHTRSTSSHKLVKLEKSLKKDSRSITPIARKELRLGIAAYPMNAKHIFEALKYKY